MKKATRISPSRATVRQLYLKSGNRCAFPNCTKFLFNETGTFIGEICHIEAAEPGGERFNSSQSPQERADFENLLLMCHDHHLETNDVGKFDVARMKKIKSMHESLYSDVVGKMLLKVGDHTKKQKSCPAKNLKKINEVLKWGHSDAELSENIKDLNELLERLKKVPMPARELLLIVVERAEKSDFGSGLEVQGPEIVHATGLSNTDLRGLFTILDKYGFTDENGEEFGVEMIGIQSTRDGWPVFEDRKSVV